MSLRKNTLMKTITIIYSQRVMGVKGLDIYVIMLPSSGFSVTQYS